MKILMVAHSFPPDAFAGVENHVYHLARILGERHEVKVFHRIEDRSGQEYALSEGAFEGVPTVRVVNNFTYSDPHELHVVPGVREAFSRVLDREKPDVVHVHHLICLSADLPDELKDRGIPAVASLHDYWYLCARVQLYVPGKGRCKGPGVFRCPDCHEIDEELVHSMSRFAFLGDRGARLWMRFFSQVDWPDIIAVYERRSDRMGRTLSRFDRLIANSNHLRNRYIRFGVPADRMSVMHPGLDGALLRKARHPLGAEVRFGYVGSIVEHKGLHVLLEAFRRVPEAPLKIWGDPDVNPTVQAYRSTLDPSKNVRFMGPFAPREIGTVLSKLDVLVVPSLWEEAYGMTVDEAKAAGIPVIASRIGGIPEHLAHGREGFLFSPGNVDELESLIRRLAGRPDRVEALRPAGDDVPELEENACDAEAMYHAVIRGKGRMGVDGK